MTEEEKRNESQAGKTEANGDTDLLETIKNLKESTVSKSDYEKMKAERNKLLNDYVNNVQPEQVTVVDSKETISKLRKELYTEDGVDGMTNLDYWKKTIQLRQNIIDSGKPDPSLPMKGSTAYDEELSEKVFDVVQECIDECHDNPAVFNSLLSQRTR